MNATATKKRVVVRWNASEREQVLAWGIEYMRNNGAPPTLLQAQEAVITDPKRIRSTQSVKQDNAQWREAVRKAYTARPEPVVELPPPQATVKPQAEAEQQALVDRDLKLMDDAWHGGMESERERWLAKPPPTIAQLLVRTIEDVVVALLKSERIRAAAREAVVDVLTPRATPRRTVQLEDADQSVQSREHHEEEPGDAIGNVASYEPERREPEPPTPAEPEFGPLPTTPGVERKPTVVLAGIRHKHMAPIVEAFEKQLKIREWDMDQPVSILERIVDSADFVVFYEGISQHAKKVIKEATHRWHMGRTPHDIRAALTKLSPRH